MICYLDLFAIRIGLTLLPFSSVWFLIARDHGPTGVEKISVLFATRGWWFNYWLVIIRILRFPASCILHSIWRSFQSSWRFSVVVSALGLAYLIAILTLLTMGYSITIAQNGPLRDPSATATYLCKQKFNLFLSYAIKENFPGLAIIIILYILYLLLVFAISILLIVSVRKRDHSTMIPFLILMVCIVARSI